jgi:hypothetical protein
MFPFGYINVDEDLEFPRQDFLYKRRMDRSEPFPLYGSDGPLDARTF